MKSEIDYKELITRFLGKNLNEAELTLLTDWINESYTNRKIFDQYNELWQMSSVILDERHFNTDTGWDSLHQEMKKSGPAYNSDIQLIKNNHLSLWRITSVAAMLIAALFIGLFFEKTSKSTKIQFVTIQSPRGEKSKVILADSTVVWLNSDSKLTYSNDFDSDIRLVLLTGEGYFDVKKNRSKPFIVRTASADITVFGTRFNVSAYADEPSTEATLEEGKIGVYISGHSSPVSVKPGERMVYNNISDEVSLNNVNTDLYTSWKENKLRFDDAHFGDVVKKLERWYDVKIILDKGLKYSERYTMTIKTESLREVLNRLSLTTPMNYKIEEEKVFIYPGK